MFAFQIGLTLRRGSQTLEFVRQLENNQVQFEDAITRRSYTWEIAKVVKEILDGDLQVVGALQVKDVANCKVSNFISDIDSLPEKYKRDLQYKIRLIKWIKKHGASRGQRDVIKSLLLKFSASDEEKRLPLSASIAMKWMRRWDESGGNPASLVSKNYQKQRSKDFPHVVEEEMNKVLRTEYLIRSRPPLDYAFTILRRNLKGLAANGILSVSESEVSISSFRRRLLQVDPYRRDVLRYGAVYARNKWRYSLKGTQAIRVLQRLEVDHTILDIVVISDTTGMPLGRPVITIIVDAYSGYLVGFYISFAGAGLAAVLNAMKIGLMPKEDFTKNAPFLKHPWLGYGVGESYGIDNGLEFHSPQFVSAALELNTDVQYCAVRQPWLKPNVERYFRDLGYNLPQSGRVLKPVINSLPLNPRDTARITFSDLCKGLLKYFVDVHPLKVNSRTLERPLDLFKEGFEQTPPPLLPTNLEKLGIIAAHRKHLTVGNEGIVMPGLRFNSTDLQATRRQIQSTYKTAVKFDPEDLGYIYVQHPKSLEWMYVPNCHPEYADNLSMIQHNAIRMQRKGALHARSAVEDYLRAKLELSELWQSMERGKKLKRDQKALIQFAGLSSTKFLANPDKHTVSASSKLATEDDFQQPEDAVPDFDAYTFD